MDFERIVCVVADGLGVGALPDAELYHNEGSHTLGHVVQVTRVKLPNLEKLGLGNLPGTHLSHNPNPVGWIGRMAERSVGKDTTTGHWEIAGVLTEKPFALFPNGFPEDLVEAFIQEANIPGILGNKPASGTVIIEELGEEHLKSLKPILYTSGDSVFQLAAHEEAFGLKRLYEICEDARRLTLPYQIGRVIARPFVGKERGQFKRTQNRRDYSIAPPTHLLDVLSTHSISVYAVGKIDDIFDHRGITEGNHTGNNVDSLGATLEFLVKSRDKRAFIFTNLVDFDMLYGHRRDPKGFAAALVEMDEFFTLIFSELSEKDLFILTADHGCDPTYPGTDHTREYVPLVVYRKNGCGGSLGDRETFSDVASTILEAFGLSNNRLFESGKSFLCQLVKS